MVQIDQPNKQECHKYKRQKHEQKNFKHKGRFGSVLSPLNFYLLRTVGEIIARDTVLESLECDRYFPTSIRCTSTNPTNRRVEKTKEATQTETSSNIISFWDLCYFLWSFSYQEPLENNDRTLSFPKMYHFYLCYLLWTFTYWEPLAR